jgi:hypothetical protein
LFDFPYYIHRARLDLLGQPLEEHRIFSLGRMRDWPHSGQMDAKHHTEYQGKIRPDELLSWTLIAKHSQAV